MRKLVFFIVFAALLLGLTSCTLSDIPLGGTNGGTNNPIDFGKKYMLTETRYYLFNADGTGYCECRAEKGSYTLSGRVDFAWREASDGAVHLFRTGTQYNEDHTEGYSIPLIGDPIYFAEEFFVYSYVSGYASSYGGNTSSGTTRYIKEGSALGQLVE